MGTAVITIRPMTHEDLTPVVALEKANQPRPWSERVFRDELGADNRTYVVAVDPELVGLVLWAHDIDGPEYREVLR